MSTPTGHAPHNSREANVTPQELTDEAVQLVRRWLTEGSKFPVDKSAEQLAGVLNDPNGLDFTVGFVDGVVRPEDLRVAATNLKALAPITPGFLPWYMKFAIQLGGILAVVAPHLVIPIARKVLRHMVGHLIIDATDAKLGKSITKIKTDGVRLNINLLGEAILGEREAARRLDGTRKLLTRDDVDYVSIKVSSTMAPHNHWAFDDAVTHVVENLSPLYRIAANATPRHKFINLDMEEYKDLDLTIAVFTTLLDQPEFEKLEAGIVLQAYLPDALAAMMHLQEWAAARVARGGAPIKVRVVKGANLPMEHADADLHGWPLATWHTKQESDTSYKAVLDYALRPEHTRNVRIGVAGHNLFDIALAWLLATKRDVTDGVEFEMLLGMATGQAEAVRRDVGSLLLYTPVVHPREFDVAIAYLIRRLEEGASKENFMSAVFELDKNEALFEREKQRFLASVHALTDEVPTPHRIQDRNRPQPPAPRTGFINTPDTDPDLPGNRAWGRAIAERMEHSTLGSELVEESWVATEDELDTIMSRGAKAAASWQALTADERAEILHRAGDVLERKRADLLEVMGSECGKTLDQGDPEVSEAIDFAHYYAELGRELQKTNGAEFVPSALTVVTPPWNFPVAIPAGSTLSALASGSAVVIKPAGPAARSGAVMVEALWEAGVPRDVLQFVQLGERELGTQFISHHLVERLILTGAYETAELFRSFRPDLPLLAETSGKNAVIVTPSADLDLAAKDVAYSAFGHAGQKCSAASLVILVGSVSTSKRFRNQLIDAVQSLHVGYPWDQRTQMGPIIEPASGKLLRGLTTLGDGENWVLKPTQLDSSGKLWSPGVRDNVERGSEYHTTEYFGPILGIMTAGTLDEAVDMVNEIDYGLTTGLHSLNPDEIKYWMNHIEAGNLYVNRGITGAIVQRQPFGGWKKSAIGAGTKAGGPNYLVGLGTWRDAPVEPTLAPITGPPSAIATALEGVLSTADMEWLRAAIATDASVWNSEFGIAYDRTGLHAERNLLRYRTVPVVVRYEEGTSGHGVAELARVVAAGLRCGAHISVSSAAALPPEMLDIIGAQGVSINTETTQQWHQHVAHLAAGAARIRLIGGDYTATAKAANGKPDIAIYASPVVSAGRVEMLPFLREQAVSITAHRYGTPNHLTDNII
ncbi:bifunctional proline dehydrogenase/L-glutamate gamma-semialdehyde dehydrogenase [Hoyosella rhizosphaerae]|uniref:L-glutamate gamma-semialdehyde dehydrogenase n=1 Tax=Hoyosella rhizosphaerae TaxID=1755582 RepID=A0A916U2B1_9ACTN|nr:bifunctional proline dehydrogenase/L-glutamate gamma-semialdehyde dehydrogenase [Hoyosella rhizosphaerae]MBN4926631.1 bifunctional proline dehydrogenase/L-glutamate gamma-semialdehyde dehydrogenase [Hoyosella rhizosphaerae]GGC57686.1 proline dehydrogenase [Hoyosella rhizosphaerae]